MVRIDILRDDDHKRILRCSEGNRVWYRLWINPEDMMRIEPLLEGGDRIWMEELEMYYLFFYEMVEGLLGRIRLRRYWIFFCEMNARDVFILWLFVCCVLVCP